MKRTIQICILLLSFTFINQSFACSYMYQEPQETFEQNSIVFIGKIKKVTHEGGLNGTRSVTFEILKKYKGDISEEITLSTGANSAMCGFEKDTLVVSDIWVIHTQDTKSFISLPHNIKYESLSDAQKALDPLVEKPTVCPLNYAPVCGQKDTGIRCVTTPCPSMEQKTYGNSCQLAVDEAEFLYEGECKEEQEETPKPNIKPKPQTQEEEVPEAISTSSVPMNTIETETVGFFSRILNFFKRLLGF